VSLAQEAKKTRHFGQVPKHSSQALDDGKV